jgi:hypothetical protein
MIPYRNVFPFRKQPAGHAPTSLVRVKILDSATHAATCCSRAVGPEQPQPTQSGCRVIAPATAGINPKRASMDLRLEQMDILKALD